MQNHIAINMPVRKAPSHIALNMPVRKTPSHIAVNIPFRGSNISRRNSNASLKHKKSSRNVMTRRRSSKSIYKPNKYNAHIVNTNDPLWLEKEGINTSYNINVESRKKWLAKQKNRS